MIQPYNQVFYATNAGGTWVVQNVTAAGDLQIAPSLAFDSANCPSIACLSLHDGLELLTKETNGTWTKSIVNPSVQDVYFTIMSGRTSPFA